MGGKGKGIVNQGQPGLRHDEFKNSAGYKNLPQKEKYDYLLNITSGF